MQHWESYTEDSGAEKKRYTIICPECDAHYRKVLEVGIVHSLKCSECGHRFDFNADAPH